MWVKRSHSGPQLLCLLICSLSSAKQYCLSSSDLLELTRFRRDFLSYSERVRSPMADPHLLAEVPA